MLDESCGIDVEEELALELEDNPRTTIGTKCSVLHIIIFPFLLSFGFLTTGPLKFKSVFFAELAQRQDYRRVLEDLHRHIELKIVNVFCCFLICLHFPIDDDDDDTRRSSQSRAQRN